MFYKDDRLAIFIDGANLYASAKALGFDIDYKLLRQEFDRRGKLMRAYYYTALMEGEDYSPIRPLVDWLHYNGYCVVTKPAKEYTDTMGRRKVKGNMDIELTIDAMQLAPRLDHVVRVGACAISEQFRVRLGAPAANHVLRLEDEQREFRDFLTRLRMAKDKAEFDQFMAERRSRGNDAPAQPSPQQG